MTAKIFAVDSVQTLDDFERDALRVADVIRELGVNPGDRVILKAGNSAAYVSVLFALMHVGASIVLVDQQEHADETRRIAQRTHTALSFVDDDAPIDDDARAVNLYELIAPAAGRPATGQRLCFDAWGARPDGLIMWTSGSTGTPKGAVKSGRKFLKNLERNAAQVGHRPDDVLMPLLPFAHQYGLSMVLIAWLTRCSLVIAPYKRLDRAVQMAGRTGTTVIDATPASYRSILNLVTRKPSLRAHLAPVRMFCSGAAPLDGTLNDAYVAEFGLPLLDSYGSTELGNIAFATLDNPVSCGRAMDGIKLRVVDEDGVPVAAGEAGEIEVDTPDALEGHLADDGGIDSVPSGWQRTGDLGYLDASDNLYVLGRKFAVHRMGYTLYPELIERKAAVAHISTRIVPLPDERRGAQLVFFVEDDQLRDAAHWRDLLAAALPAYEQPNRVVVLDSFPLNRNGKPDKRQLEKLARQ
ncbi:class I adenylate-forming enzyme family protein [Streptomyces sp. XD-27]|uniref:class I adenylate-forming enzyme family protein n=1 Tax=Streptomyces sp. XD-27 TaxID=3062779 RepID=UPI0026F45258|nr:class I adenylate-forming enzyme family protein [Streptomyces sp. XD-27]WKX70493.1 class I adenylate-forming enzyme family protein [Streptomyces sp. XD-27]